MSNTIVIVDDHELVAQGVSKFFVEDPRFELLAIFTNPKEALSKIPELKPDIVFTDLDMPELNGLELIERLQMAFPGFKKILLTMHLNQQVMKKVVSNQFDGYLPKNADEFEFIQCLETVIKGRKYYSQRAMEMLNDSSVALKQTGLKKTQMLSEREKEILTHVAEGYSTKEIAEKLIIAVRTVETHRKAIMEKLEVKNLAGMVRIAVQEGLI
ncbi:MAG: response regulator transcription factor [Bacteroidota bacterium]